MESTYTDYYLKFASKEEYESAMPEELKSPAGQNHAVDVIGIIYHDGTYDENGETISPPTPIDGYHVNLRMVNAPLPESLVAYTIEAPSTPKRVWA